MERKFIKIGLFVLLFAGFIFNKNEAFAASSSKTVKITVVDTIYTASGSGITQSGIVESRAVKKEKKLKVTCKYSKLGQLTVTFSEKMDFSEDSGIAIVDDDGISYNIAILKIDKNKKKCIAQAMLDSGTVKNYTLTVSGIKRLKDEEYGSVAVKFAIKK